MALLGIILLRCKEFFDVLPHILLSSFAKKRMFLILPSLVNAVRFYYSAGREYFERENYEIIADVMDMLSRARVP